MDLKLGAGSKYGMQEAAAKTQPKIDVSAQPTLLCDCGNATFAAVFVLKEISAIVSPDGEYHLAPMAVFACNSCGQVPKKILDKTNKGE